MVKWGNFLFSRGLSLRRPGILGLLLILLGSGLPVRGDDFLVIQRRLVELFEQYEPAVVRVKASFEEVDENGDVKAALRVGSGFFISREGHLLTNASVAHEATRVWVEHRGRAYAAESVGHDPETNLSLLRVLSVPEDMNAISLSSPLRNPSVGTIVIGITQPLDLSPGPVFGLLTGYEGQFAQRIFPTQYWRVSIPAYPGEGGSPVFFLDGRLAGIIVASLPEIRSSYILPVEAILRVRDELLDNGTIQYGWLGMDLEETWDREAGSRLKIREIAPNGPAYRVGLKSGDFLLEFGGIPVKTLGDVRRANFFHPVGSYLEVRWEREGEVQQGTLRSASPPTGDDGATTQSAASNLAEDA